MRAIEFLFTPGRSATVCLDSHSAIDPTRMVSFFPNIFKAQAELRCTHAEETDSAQTKINDFDQETDYLLLYRT